MARPRTGSVRFRAGRGWVARLAGEHLGYYPTEEAAQEAVAAAMALDSGKAPDSLRVYGTRWIARRELDARARGKARAGLVELSRWNTHVATAPFFDKPLRAITPKHVQQWVREQDVCTWLGHSDIGVTQRHYAALSKDSLTSRVQRILSAKPRNEGTQES